MNDEVRKIVDKLGLEPHPEGGFFKETYRSVRLAQVAFDNEGKVTRNFATAIYFLLNSENFSAFHRIKQDEIWHHYSGDPVTIHMINHNGQYSKFELGSVLDGFLPQFVVSSNVWFASEVTTKNGYALVGCDVSPGFDFADFELAKRGDLIKSFPQHKEIIARLTRD